MCALIFPFSHIHVLGETGDSASVNQCVQCGELSDLKSVFFLVNLGIQLRRTANKTAKSCTCFSVVNQRYCDTIVLIVEVSSGGVLV